VPPSAYYGPGAEVKKARDATLPALRSAQAGVTGQSPELRSIKPGLRSDHALLGSWPEVQLVRLQASYGEAFTFQLTVCRHLRLRPGGCRKPVLHAMDISWSQM
jgi:hypothetical protein